jgi:hypothetical protein
MSLASAGVTEQHQRLAGVDPRPGGQGGESGGDAGDRVGAEVGQPLDPGEAGFGDAAGPAAAGALVDGAATSQSPTTRRSSITTEDRDDAEQAADPC